MLLMFFSIPAEASASQLQAQGTSVSHCQAHASGYSGAPALLRVEVLQGVGLKRFQDLGKGKIGKESTP